MAARTPVPRTPEAVSHHPCLQCRQEVGPLWGAVLLNMLPRGHGNRLQNTPESTLPKGPETALRAQRTDTHRKPCGLSPVLWDLQNLGPGAAHGPTCLASIFLPPSAPCLARQLTCSAT